MGGSLCFKGSREIERKQRSLGLKKNGVNKNSSDKIHGRGLTQLEKT